MSPASNEKQLREDLGYGCDEAVLISDRKLGEADALATSYTLFKGTEKCGPFDLVLLGNISDDGSTAHVPSQLVEWLGVLHLTDVVSFDMAIEICKKYGMDLPDKRIKLAFGISARALQKFPATGVSAENLEAMNKELIEAGL